MASKLFKCFVCGKEFTFDYGNLIKDLDLTNPDNPKNKDLITSYNRDMNFPMETNICMNCLDKLQTNKDISFGNQREDNANVQSICETRIEELKTKFKDESEFSDFTEEIEQSTLSKLNDIKKEVTKNEIKLQTLLGELKKASQKEQKFWDEYKNFEKNIFEVEKNLSRSNDINLEYQKKIKSFAGSNIFSDLFQISFSDKFAIINGCKFCDPTNSGNYDMISAGWGYVVLLTKLIAVRYEFNSNNFELVPEGNYSFIEEKAGKKKIYELTANEMSIAKGSFNLAMEKYLCFLKEMMSNLLTLKKIETKNEDFCPKIDGDKVGEKSIRFESSRQEDWYQCMKYLLTILKFLISQILIQENKSYKATIDTIELINHNSAFNKENNVKINECEGSNISLSKDNDS